MKYSHKTLKNGLQIVTIPMPSNQTVTVSVAVETGSDFEDKKINGISHFLEHLCFKGTKKRNVFEIHEAIDSLGAQNNAFTSKEHTSYYAKAHYKHLDDLLDVISDIYLNSTLPKEEIEKERGVVIEEINMYEDLPRWKVWDIFAQLVHGDTPAGRTIIGPKENIEKLTRAQILAYKKKHYVAEATTIIVSGRVDVKDVEKKVTALFKNVPSSKKHQKKVPTTKIGPAVGIAKRKVDQAHFMLGFQGFSLHDEDRVVAEVLASILGGGMSSRLFKRMRDELGLCYYVGADNDNFTDYGWFVIYAGVNKKRLQESVSAIVEMLSDLKHNEVAEKELEKAKESLIGNTALSIESSNALGNWMGFQAVHHEKMSTPEEYYKTIRKVTAEDIIRVAERTFVDKRSYLGVVSDLPKSDEKKLKKLLAFD